MYALVSYVCVSGVPSTHFHCPSTPSSVRPIQTSLSLLYKPLMKVCEGKETHKLHNHKYNKHRKHNQIFFCASTNKYQIKHDIKLQILDENPACVETPSPLHPSITDFAAVFVICSPIAAKTNPSSPGNPNMRLIFNLQKLRCVLR